MVASWSSRLEINRLSSRDEIGLVAWVKGGEATVVFVVAGVEGTKEDSGLVTNPPELSSAMTGTQNVS